jgi:hypothetical protein
MEMQLLIHCGDLGAFLRIEAAQREGEIAGLSEAQVRSCCRDDMQRSSVLPEEIPQRLESPGFPFGPFGLVGLCRAREGECRLGEDAADHRVPGVAFSIQAPGCVRVAADAYRHRHGGQVFGDEVLATAILDRLLHQCDVVSINGPSYRLKNRLAAIERETAA